MARRFGSPTAVHEKEAAQDARRAVKLARSSMRLMEKGQCGPALGLLTNAHYYAGEANMSAISAGYGKARIAGRTLRAMRIGTHSDAAVNKATTRFRYVCLRG